jgi:hypothetical protein
MSLAEVPQGPLVAALMKELKIVPSSLSAWTVQKPHHAKIIMLASKIQKPFFGILNSAPLYPLP